MEEIDKADTGQAQIGQGATANQRFTDQTEVLKLVKPPPFRQTPQRTPHGRTEVEITVIDVRRRSDKLAVMGLAIGLDQLVHPAPLTMTGAAMLAPPGGRASHPSRQPQGLNQPAITAPCRPVPLDCAPRPWPRTARGQRARKAGSAPQPAAAASRPHPRTA